MFRGRPETTRAFELDVLTVTPRYKTPHMRLTSGDWLGIATAATKTGNTFRIILIEGIMRSMNPCAWPWALLLRSSIRSCHDWNLAMASLCGWFFHWLSTSFCSHCATACFQRNRSDTKSSSGNVSSAGGVADGVWKLAFSVVWSCDRTVASMIAIRLSKASGNSVSSSRDDKYVVRAAMSKDQAQRMCHAFWRRTRRSLTMSGGVRGITDAGNCPRSTGVCKNLRDRDGDLW